VADVRFISTRICRRSLSNVPVLLVSITLCCGFSLAKDFKSKPKCHGLHAGIRVQFVNNESGVTHPAYVWVTFLLLNDAETLQDVDAKSWTLVVDGIELKDSVMIFGNGVIPAEGYKSLKAGDHYEFSKGLELTKYFPHPGQHKVSWRGKNFGSATVTISTP